MLDPDLTNTQDFLEDFGVLCKVNGAEFLAIMDSPDEIVEMFSNQVVSRAFKLRYASSDVDLPVGCRITIVDHVYRVQKPTMKVGDGVFSEVEVELIK